MELLQKTDINVGQIRGGSVDKSSRSKPPYEEKAQTERPFKDQLEEKIDQAKLPQKSNKTDKNQQDKLSAEEVKEAPVKMSQVIDKSDAKDASDVDIADNENAIINDITIQQIVDGVESRVAALLPPAGVMLPPPSTGGRVLVTNALTQEQLNIDSTKLRPNQQQTNLPTIEQLERGSISKSPRIITDYKPFNSQQAGTSKSSLQDIRYARAISESPAAEIVTQASRLQQVPLTTAISANLASIQNSATAIATEPSSANNTSVLSNTFNSAIPTNIQTPGWSQQMSQQVSFMIKGGFQQAQIKLNPAHLGPMEIKLAVNDDQATISFVTQHAPVRDALDAAMPRLKEMLEQQGLNLADVDVSTQSENRENKQSGEAATSSDVDDLQDGLQANSDVVEKVINVDVKTGVSVFA